MTSILNSPKLSRAEVAQKMGVTEISVDRYARVGLRGHKLPRVRIGGRSYYLVADIERWLCATGDNQPGRDADDAEEHDSAMAECAALGV